MLSLPQSTEFKKRIPKQKFYERLTPPLKKLFAEQIKTIWWQNKLAPSTTNLAAGSEVRELEVFELRLNAPLLDEELLRQIDRVIPYHILFVAEYEGRYQAWIGYKEIGDRAVRVNRYYHTEWLAAAELKLRLQGLDMDAVYASFVRQIAGTELQAIADEELRTSVERAQQRERLQRRIDALQNKIRRERQLNRQMEMNGELKRLKQEMEVL